MKDKKVSEVEGVFSRGVDMFILRRTTRILDRSDLRNAGSGIFLRFGDHLFVATAAHVIRKSHEYSILPSVPNAREFSDFLRKHINCHDDVGILELNPKSIGSFFDLCEYEFLELGELYRGRYPSSKKSIRVVGYPGHFPMQAETTVRISPDTVLHQVECKTLDYVTSTLARAEWPVLSNLDRPIRRGRDIFCSFEPECENVIEQHFDWHSSTSKRHELTSLPLTGMSGGGLWIATEDFNDSTVSIPTAVLVGLQSSYSEKGRGKWLRGSRVVAILDLLATHYSPLSERMTV